MLQPPLASVLPQLVYETDTSYGHYQVWDILYDDRPARVLYSGQRQTAQSGMAVDDNANLLFDYNQRFYELVTGLLPKRLLLIGGGTYTLPMALLAALPMIEIDVVEINDQLIAIAERFFGLHTDSRLQIMHQDGRAFLETNASRYDVILIDAFLNADTPESLTQVAAVALIKQRLTANGVVAFNSIASFFGSRSDNLHQRMAALATSFDDRAVFPAGTGLSLWLPQNLLLVAQAGKHHPVESYLRYPMLSETDQSPDFKRDIGRL